MDGMRRIEMSDAEVDELLGRFDRTDPALQRRIVARLAADRLLLMEVAQSALEVSRTGIVGSGRQLAVLRAVTRAAQDGPAADMFDVHRRRCRAMLEAGQLLCNLLTEAAGVAKENGLDWALGRDWAGKAQSAVVAFDRAACGEDG